MFGTLFFLPLVLNFLATAHADGPETEMRSGKDAMWYVPSFGGPAGYAHVPGTPYFRSGAEAEEPISDRAGKDAMWYVPSFGGPAGYAHVPGTPYFRSGAEAEEAVDRAGKDALLYVPSFGNPSYAHVPGTPYFRSGANDQSSKSRALRLPPPYYPYSEPFFKYQQAPFYM